MATETKTTLEVVQGEVDDLLRATGSMDTNVWAAQLQVAATVALAEEVKALRELLDRVVGDDPAALGLRTPAYVRTNRI